MLKLILGRAGSGKTTAVYRRMCGAGAERPQVLLVPEQNSHEAERALCKVGGNGVSLYAEVLSFSRLANRVFLAAGGLGEAELDAGGRLLLMHRAVKSVAAQLTVCARSAGRASFLRSLIATVDELKSCRVLRGMEGSDYDAVLISEFENREALERYKNDPRHKAVSALCKSIRMDRAAVDCLLPD